MKQVTIAGVKDFINEIEKGGLSLREEYVLACLRELVAVTEQRDELVVESAGLKSALTAILQPGEATLSREHRATAVAAIEAPATEAAIAALRAEGIEQWIASRNGAWNGTTKQAEEFARQLRESKGEVQS